MFFFDTFKMFTDSWITYKYRNINHSTLDKPTWLFASNFMFYFFTFVEISNQLFIGHEWQEVARRIPLNLIEYGTCRAYAENYCAQWGLYYWFMITLQFRWRVIQFFIIKCGGHKILPRYVWNFWTPYFKVWWSHNSFIYVFFW